MIRANAESKGKKLLVSTEAVFPDGSVKIVREIIPANMKAARDWLGY